MCYQDWGFVQPGHFTYKIKNNAIDEWQKRSYHQQHLPPLPNNTKQRKERGRLKEC